MRFFADLHVHSRHSRATSRDLDLEHLSFWAQKKGIHVVGTGDFTHPIWLAELKQKLVPAEPGLYRLRDDIERDVASWLPASCRTPTRFMLEVEISTIYKKGEKTRKVHHLIYAPDFEHVDRMVAALSKIGNLKSDGRPILGLDSRHLLEIVLEAGPGSYLVPAHIWTPWFSAMGSKSGFDSIDECYGDLAQHIFAVETGLSSDPPMNWRLSALDRFTLVSNSDAHSPAKLGREACAFHTELDYFAMRRALETREGYGGTVEFFPEEGKYHLDGHRSCKVRLEPEETKALGGLCPSCGRALTVGVMARVDELADRNGDFRPENPGEFKNFIPLPEVIGETLDKGVASQATQQVYDHTLSKLGPELHLLEATPIEDIARQASPLLAEAVARMRRGEVIREAGYDGEYGVIRCFTPDELSTRHSGKLFQEESLPSGKARTKVQASLRASEALTENVAQVIVPPQRVAHATAASALDEEQRAAVEHGAGPMLIVAGPGTGKTRTLTHRIAHLIEHYGVRPEQCLAITFTRRAASEMRERLSELLPRSKQGVRVETFHSFAYSIVREYSARLALGDSVRIATESERLQVVQRELGIAPAKARSLLSKLSNGKRKSSQEASSAAIGADDVARYDAGLRKLGLIDFDDVMRYALDAFLQYHDIRARHSAMHPWVFIDEYQDIDAQQYQLMRLLAAADGNVCAIGDPDQAIYSFRGAEVGFFLRFREDFPGATHVQLTRNYRSSKPIVAAALSVIAPSALVSERRLESVHGDGLKLAVLEAATEAAEAETIVHRIERLLGGATLFSFDSGRVAGDEGGTYDFSDIAVLYRTEAQAEALKKALERAGFPYQSCTHRLLADNPLVRAVLAKMAEFGQVERVREQLRRATHVVESDPALSRVDIAHCVAALTTIAERHPDDFGAFLNEVETLEEIDQWDPRARCISLLTLHASKGLEFPVVFIAGCEDGLLPLRFGDECNLDEERRLFFVGITRAKERLMLTHARRRRRQGKLATSEPSPFLRDIDALLLETERRRAAQSSQHQLNLF